MGLGVIWIDVPLAVVCLLAGLHYIGLLVARRGPVVASAAPAVMGLGMAAMFAPAADPVPDPVWVVVFLLVAAGFGAAVLRAGSLLGEPGHHAVGAVAMVFMLLVHAHGPAGPPLGSADPEPAHHGGAAGGAPGIGLLLTAVALAFAAWFIADIARGLAHSGAGPAGAASRAAVASTAGTAVAPPVVPGAPSALRSMPLARPVMSAAMVVMLVGMA